MYLDKLQLFSVMSNFNLHKRCKKCQPIGLDDMQADHNGQVNIL